jgi:hypothetical protein
MALNVALHGQYLNAHSPSHSGSIKQNLRKSASLDIHDTQDRLGETFRSEKMVQATTSTQTSPVKVISKPKPLKH